MSKNIKSWISDSYISAKAEAYLQQSANNSSNNKKKRENYSNRNLLLVGSRYLNKSIPKKNLEYVRILFGFVCILSQKFNFNLTVPVHMVLSVIWAEPFAIALARAHSNIVRHALHIANYIEIMVHLSWTDHIYIIFREAHTNINAIEEHTASTSNISIGISSNGSRAASHTNGIVLHTNTHNERIGHFWKLHVTLKICKTWHIFFSLHCCSSRV